MNRTVRSSLGVTGLGAAGLAYASLVERQNFRLRHLTVPALHASASQPLRLLHLTDLHLSPGQERKLAFVRTCAATAGPDVVVATGDILGHAEAVEPAIAALNDVARGRVAIAVLGSNDVYAPQPKNPARYLQAPSTPHGGARLDTDRFLEGLRSGGWQVFDNRRAEVATPAGPIDIAGLGDPHAGWDRPDDVDWSPPPEAVPLRLGLVHAPYRRALDVLAGAGYDLLMAGHTHGGQLRIPGVGALVDNCDLPLRQARGLSRYRDSWLHVSAGLGESRYAPVRFACPPEASILDLVPRVPGSTL